LRERSLHQDGVIVGDIVRVNPGIDRKGRQVEVVCVVDTDVVINSVETERLFYLAGCEGSAALQRTVIGILNVIGISIARPPANHVVRRSYARALTGAAGIVDPLDFSLN
jgi:hypothetical protein